MKLLLILLLLFASPVLAFEHHLDWNATFIPPHNEPVVGNKVARYRLQLEPSFQLGWVNYVGQVNLWAVNTWQRPSSQQSTAWEHDDWTIEDWRVSLQHRIYVGTGKVRLFTEYYQPLDRGNWGKAGSSMRDYWWLVGFAGRLW